MPKKNRNYYPIADIKNLAYPSSAGSGQSFDITWDIENISSGSGYLWTQLENLTLHMTIYGDTSYYNSGQTRGHLKRDIIYQHTDYHLTAGHFDTSHIPSRRIQDDEVFFDIYAS